MRIGVIALLLLPPGLGHIAIRRYSKGIVLWMASVFSVMGVLLVHFLVSEPGAAKTSALVLLSLPLLVSWAYSIYDLIAICGVFRGEISQEEKDEHFRQGMKHYLRNELDAAAAAFERVLDLDRRDVEALFQLAMVHKGKGERKQAIAAFKKCLALDAEEKWRSEIEEEMLGLNEALETDGREVEG